MMNSRQELLNFARWRHLVYDDFDEYGINGWLHNKTSPKCTKNNRNWIRRFEDVSRRCEPSDVVALYFLAHHVDVLAATWFVCLSPCWSHG